MKKLHLFFISLFCSTIFGQDILEKSVESDVSEVTVFLDGAQVSRQQKISLSKGKTIIKFVNLSPFIDAKSVQVKAEGPVIVLSVNHQQNYLDKAEKSQELTDMQNQLDELEEKINLENTYLEIIREELVFLQQNRSIGGKNEELSATNLQQTAEFYSRKLTDLKLKEIEREKNVNDLNDRKNDIRNQINTLSNKREFPTGEILIKVDAKQAQSFSMELSYLVANASWFPSYDIRAENINEPVRLIYKANVKQDTKVNWKNVKLSFSSATPNVSGVAPQLQPYYLNFNMAPPTYRLSSNTVRGRVTDNQGIPLPGVSVNVEGTTIGTVTDMEGNFSITIPDQSSRLSFSYIGYNSQTRSISGNIMNVSLSENNMELDEVVVTGYGSMERAVQGKVAGISTKNADMRVRGASSLSVPTAQVENQTTVDFKINTPYTVLSDNKNYTVDMAVYDLPAFYQYYSVPKIDKDAFLIAHIVDWEKYNLLEGEANVFFEDTYIGKTIMDVRYASDTLEISLGRDKQVAVNREKIKDFTDKQFIGNKKEETRAYEITVRNNKKQMINMIMHDQVPVPTTEEITLDVQNISGARRNSETGELTWKFQLKPAEQKEFELRYSAKYPKNRNLMLD